MGRVANVAWTCQQQIISRHWPSGALLFEQRKLFIISMDQYCSPKHDLNLGSGRIALWRLQSYCFSHSATTAGLCNNLFTSYLRKVLHQCVLYRRFSVLCKNKFTIRNFSLKLFHFRVRESTTTNSLDGSNRTRTVSVFRVGSWGQTRSYPSTQRSTHRRFIRLCREWRIWRSRKLLNLKNVFGPWAQTQIR